MCWHLIKCNGIRRATDMKGLCAQQIIKIVSFSESFDSRFHNVGIIYIVDNEIYNGVKFTKNKKFNNLNAALVILLKPFRTNERTKKKWLVSQRNGFSLYRIHGSLVCSVSIFWLVFVWKNSHVFCNDIICAVTQNRWNKM